MLIGIPGLEKRMARYPQLSSRIGFVHEFQPLAETEMRGFLSLHWLPSGVNRPSEPPAENVLAAILRVIGGNFRLFTRPLTHIERILQINGLQRLTQEAVETARASLVIASS